MNELPITTREVDDRTFNRHGILTGGSVRQVLVVGGEEYDPRPTEDRVAATEAHVAETRDGKPAEQSAPVKPRPVPKPAPARKTGK